MDSIREVINANSRTNYTIAKSAIEWILPKLLVCNDTVMINRSYVYLGSLSLSLSQYDEAIRYNKYLINLTNTIQPDLTTQRLAYNNLSAAMKHIGMYDSAFFYLNKAIKINKELNLSLSSNYHNLAVLYQTSGNEIKAQEYFTLASNIGIDTLATFDKNDSLRMQLTIINTVSSLAELANSSILLLDTVKAKWAYYQIDEIGKNYPMIGKAKLVTLESQFKTDLAFKNFVSALNFNTRLQRAAKENGNDFYLVRSLIGFGKLALASNGNEVAYNKAIQVMRNLNQLNLDTHDRMEYTFLISILFLKSKQADSAIFYHDKYQEFKLDETVNSNRLQLSMEQIRYRKELEDRYAMDYSELIVTSKNNTNKAWVGVVLIVISAVVIFIYFRRR
ncbi:MAG: tetratricopeptide repeat protein [Cyclobacteriaceae bacterium]